jgi:hypothetical protein
VQLFPLDRRGFRRGHRSSNRDRDHRPKMAKEWRQGNEVELLTFKTFLCPHSLANTPPPCPYPLNKNSATQWVNLAGARCMGCPRKSTVGRRGFRRGLRKQHEGARVLPCQNDPEALTINRSDIASVREQSSVSRFYFQRGVTAPASFVTSSEASFQSTFAN